MASSRKLLWSRWGLQPVALGIGSQVGVNDIGEAASGLHPSQNRQPNGFYFHMSACPGSLTSAEDGGGNMARILPPLT